MPEYTLRDGLSIDLRPARSRLIGEGPLFYVSINVKCHSGRAICLFVKNSTGRECSLTYIAFLRYARIRIAIIGGRHDGDSGERWDGDRGPNDSGLVRDAENCRLVACDRPETLVSTAFTLAADDVVR